MYFTDKTQRYFIIRSGRIANILLCKGYRITQVRPDKKNKIKTIFIFETKSTIIQDLLSIPSKAMDLF